MVKKSQHGNGADEHCVLGGDNGPHQNTEVVGSNDATGAPPSNTAPANYNEGSSGTKILRCGVDSLYLTYQGRVDREVSDHLDYLKTLAQSEDPENNAQAVHEVGNHCFEVSRYGRGKFPYLLLDNWFEVEISRHTTTRLPMSRVKVASELLTLGGVLPAVNSATGVVSTLGNIDYPVQLNRVDLCVDFVTSFDLESLPDAGWITRARRFDRYRESGHFTGLSIGMGGALSCRLYDKTAEIRKSQKDYLMPLWQSAGWQPGQQVWRLEFEFHRSVLRELGIPCYDRLLPNLAGLWEYASDRWLRLAIPSEDKNQSRWPNHPLWSVLQAVSWQDTPAIPLSRISKSRVPCDERLFVQGLAAITSFMAREGISDLHQGVDTYIRDAHSFHRKHSETTGLVLEGYVKKKVKEKAQKYNLLRSAQYRASRAKHYQKAREGE